MNQKVMEEIQRVLALVTETLYKKGKAYKNVALHPIRIFSRTSAEENIRSRIDEKLARLSSLDEHEDDEDTLLDLICYLVLLKVVRNREAERQIFTDN